MSNTNRYKAILERIFIDRFTQGATEIQFTMADYKPIADALQIELPENPADIVYSQRYRALSIPSILATQPDGYEWTIEGRGKSKYAFKLGEAVRIEPNSFLACVKIPDSTPEIIAAYALTDEQALLAKVRYNRLIDIFLSVTAYSLQNHLRTFVKDYGQIEVDELYVAVDRSGRQFIIPVQAKKRKDKLSVVQTRQDMLLCENRFPDLICRAISAQFMPDNLIAMFELGSEDGRTVIQQERHYRLSPANKINKADLERYRSAGD
jgi:hypothetical protein